MLFKAIYAVICVNFECQWKCMCLFNYESYLYHINYNGEFHLAIFTKDKEFKCFHLTWKYCLFIDIDVGRSKLISLHTSVGNWVTVIVCLITYLSILILYMLNSCYFKLCTCIMSVILLLFTVPLLTMYQNVVRNDMIFILKDTITVCLFFIFTSKNRPSLSER